jgi:hypothetical protein
VFAMSGVQLPVDINNGRIFMPKLEVYYPIVDGARDFVSDQTMNHTIYNLAYAMIADQGYYENPDIVAMMGTYDLKTNERGILSFSLLNYFFSGGAHGLTTQKSLTFEVETGKSYTLSQLFKEGSDYVKVLSDIVAKQIKQRELPLIAEYNGISPEQDFYVSDKCLILYFQLYELTPYVWGFTYFPICFYEIQDLIREDSPLQELLY